MTIDLSEQLAARLRTLADQQGRDLETLVEEAIRRYLDAAAITDVEPSDVAATQEILAGELTDLTPWPQPPIHGKPPESTDDAT